jgi:diacylglycerol O-acyltransferase
MPDSRNQEYLSYLDAGFLYLEREGIPLNVAGVCTFEGVIPLKDCIRYIETKLPELPRYRQHVVTPPFNLGLPSWEYDPNFDIRNHIREVKLRKGTEEEFKSVAGDILSTNFDRRRPLWDCTLVRGLQGNRTGFVLRIHHCLADGISGVGLLNIMMNPSPVSPKLPKKAPRFDVPPPRDPATLFLDGLLGTCFSAVNRVLTLHSEVLSVAQHVTSSASAMLPGANSALSSMQQGNHISIIEKLTRLMPEMLGPVERMPFNVTCRGPQKFRWTEISLPEIKAVKQACGATVNDVVLAVVTAAYRRYVELHGVNARGKLLRIVVPVNLRTAGDEAGLGNRITFLPIAIPMDIADPVELVHAVRKRMAFLMGIGVAEMVGMFGTLLSSLPTALQAFAGPYASLLPISLCNLICTNVPGPQVPLYLLGHKMLASYPYVPIGGEMGLNCAVLSYNGVVHFGFIGDVHAAPDMELLELCVAASFEELKSVVNARAPQQRQTPRAKRRTKPKPSQVAARRPRTASAKGKRAGISRPEPEASESQPGEMKLAVGV